MSGTESARVEQDTKLKRARKYLAEVYAAIGEREVSACLLDMKCSVAEADEVAIVAILDAIEATGWQPIESAPKNEAGEFLGPDILIYYTANGLPWPAYWGPSADSRVDGAWIGHDDDCREFSTEHVTHWMPLPAAPNLEPRHD